MFCRVKRHAATMIALLFAGGALLVLNLRPAFGARLPTVARGFPYRAWPTDLFVWDVVFALGVLLFVGSVTAWLAQRPYGAACIC